MNLLGHTRLHISGGVGVDFISYHDQWLSEGFATYSGLWYLQAAKDDNELFFDVLHEWKDKYLMFKGVSLRFGSGSWS